MNKGRYLSRTLMEFFLLHWVDIHAQCIKIYNIILDIYVLVLSTVIFDCDITIVSFIIDCLEKCRVAKVICNCN